MGGTGERRAAPPTEAKKRNHGHPFWEEPLKRAVQEHVRKPLKAEHKSPHVLENATPWTTPAPLPSSLSALLRIITFSPTEGRVFYRWRPLLTLRGREREDGQACRGGCSC